MAFPGESWAPRKGDIVRPIGYIDLGCIVTDVPLGAEKVAVLIDGTIETWATFYLELVDHISANSDLIEQFQEYVGLQNIEAEV